MSSKWIFLILIVSFAALSAVVAQPPAAPAPAATPPTSPAPYAELPPTLPRPVAESPTTPPPSPVAPAVTPPPVGTPAPAVEPKRTSTPRIVSESKSDDSESSKTVVMRLQNASATQLAEMIHNLLDPKEMGSVRTAVDERTNSVILRGSPKEIEAVTNLISQIDVEPSATSAVGRRTATVIQQGSPNDASPSPRWTAPAQPAGSAFVRVPYSIDGKLGQEFANLENQAMEIAKAYRKGAETLGQNHPQQVERREQLSKLVEKAFDLRQELQNQEVKQLKERLSKVEQSVSKRTENRSQIIDKRIKELLVEEGELDWNVGFQAVPPNVRNAYGPAHYSAGSARTNVAAVPSGISLPQPAHLPAAAAQNVFDPRIYSTAQNIPNAAQTLAAPQIAVQAIPPQRVENVTRPTGAEQRLALGQAGELVLQKEAEIAELKKRLKEEELQQNSNYQQALREFQSAQRQFEQLKRELDAQTKLLELDLQAAEAELNASRLEIQETVSSGQQPRGAMPRLNAAVQQAEIRVKRAMTMLELHRAAMQASSSSDKPTSSSSTPAANPPARR